jgi:hypothetical protein
MSNGVPRSASGSFGFEPWQFLREVDLAVAAGDRGWACSLITQAYLAFDRRTPGCNLTDRDDVPGGITNPGPPQRIGFV